VTGGGCLAIGSGCPWVSGRDGCPRTDAHRQPVLLGPRGLRLATQLHCYIPEELDETWAHLRHLSRRRSQLITQATASAQRIADFLSVAWPVAAETCAQPLESLTWLMVVQLVTSRCGAGPARLAGMGAGGLLERYALGS
jgi:hypothetical protein